MSNPITSQTGARLVSDAGAQFGLNFLRNVPDATKENVVLSPLSLQIVLGMILLGAEDRSATQLELVKVLGYDKDHHHHQDLPSGSSEKARLEVHEAMHKALWLIEKAAAQANSKELDLNLTNLVLTNADLVKPSPGYVDEMKTFYHQVQMEEFGKLKSASESRPLHERVNSWAAEATCKQITQLVKEADLKYSPELAMVLMNVAYFKGKWLKQFRADKTTDQVFYNGGLENGASKVKFMHQNGSFRYADLTADSMKASPGLHVVVDKTAKLDKSSLSRAELEHMELAAKLDCRALSMPFSLNDGNELSMVFILPNARDGLPRLLSNLSSSTLQTIYRELDEDAEKKVQIALPKFTFESTHDAKSVLELMGLTRLFSDSAELARMFAGSARKDAKVDKLLHKAKISVDESGAEAAAATVAQVSMRSASFSPRQPFKADHPFLFLLRHTPTNIVLFSGLINKL